MCLMRYINVARYVTIPNNITHNYQIKKLIVGYKLNIYVRRLHYSKKTTYLATVLLTEKKDKRDGSLFEDMIQTTRLIEVTFLNSF